MLWSNHRDGSYTCGDRNKRANDPRKRLMLTSQTDPRGRSQSRPIGVLTNQRATSKKHSASYLSTKCLGVLS